MNRKYRTLFIILSLLVLLMIIVNCSGMYNPIPLGEYIEESDGEIENEEIQGDSYLVATNEEIDEALGDLEEEPVIGTDIVIIMKVKDEKPEIEDEPKKIDDDKLSEKEKESDRETDAHKPDKPKKEEIIDKDSGKESDKDAKEEDIAIVEDEKPEDEKILIPDEDDKSTVPDDEKPEDVENFEGLHDYEPEKHTDEIDPSIDDVKPDEVKALPVKCRLGQVFTLSSKDKKIIYLFFEMLPSNKMSKVEIGKDALKMLINSVLLIANSPKKIGKVNYVVVGVEMYDDSIWYFMASYGDLVAFHKGRITTDELTKRITIKKDMPNVFKD